MNLLISDLIQAIGKCHRHVTVVRKANPWSRWNFVCQMDH
jgi:hypothetical protein